MLKRRRRSRARGIRARQSHHRSFLGWVLRQFKSVRDVLGEAAIFSRIERLGRVTSPSAKAETTKVVRSTIFKLETQMRLRTEEEEYKQRETRRRSAQLAPVSRKRIHLLYTLISFLGMHKHYTHYT